MVAIAYAVATIIAGTGVGLAAYQLAVAKQVTVSMIADTIKSLNIMLGLALSIAILSHAITKLVSGNIRVSREVTALTIVGVIVVLVDNIATALAGLKPTQLTTGYIAPLLLRTNIALYALGGVLVIALVWKLSSYLEDYIARTLERSEG